MADRKGIGEDRQTVGGNENAVGGGMALVCHPGALLLLVRRENAICARGEPTRARGQRMEVMEGRPEGGMGQRPRHRLRAGHEEELACPTPSR